MLLPCVKTGAEQTETERQEDPIVSVRANIAAAASQTVLSVDSI